MKDTASRLAALSPEKRALLERLKKKSSPEPEVESLRADDFSFHEGTLTDKEEVQRFYDRVSAQLDHGPFGQHSIFLNYGYVPNDNPTFAPVLPEQQLMRNAVRLVLELVGECPVSPQTRWLDVGCGRGGTVLTLRRYFDLGRVDAVDLAPNAVAFCQRHGLDNTFFQQGDAENLPFDQGLFDVVSNCESSHCYPDIERFYAQVARVLKPGGHFVYTDLIPTEALQVRLQMLAAVGLRLEHRRDISSNVLLSCDETAARNARAFADSNDQKLMEDFLGVPESGLYEAMKQGTQRYMLYRFRLEGGP